MTTFSSAGYALANGDGQHIWFLGTLMSIKAGREQTQAGESAANPTLPPPAEPNIAKLFAAMANYGKRMAGT
jgi:hypothetical protein